MSLRFTASAGTSSSSLGRKCGTASFVWIPLWEIKKLSPPGPISFSNPEYFSGLLFSSTFSASDVAQPLEIASSAASAALSSADTRISPVQWHFPEVTSVSNSCQTFSSAVLWRRPTTSWPCRSQTSVVDASPSLRSTAGISIAVIFVSSRRSTIEKCHAPDVRAIDGPAMRTCNADLGSGLIAMCAISVDLIIARVLVVSTDRRP